MPEELILLFNFYLLILLIYLFLLHALFISGSIHLLALLVRLVKLRFHSHFTRVNDVTVGVVVG